MERRRASQRLGCQKANNQQKVIYIIGVLAIEVRFVPVEDDFDIGEIL